VPKFKLYKHNDELFNIYYGIFLWTLNFCRFWPIMQIRKKGGWNLKNLLLTTEPISTKLCWNDPWVVPFHNCSILCQKVPKFELYKHNDELFNMYYGIFYELWTSADFDRLCKFEKKGDEIKKKSSLKLLSQSQPNFAEMILEWSPFKIVSVSAVLYPRWPPLLKIEISSNGQNCSILSKKLS
jgi:hypothetical protein